MRCLLCVIPFLLIACKKEFPDVRTEVLGHAGESLFKSKSKFPPNTLKSVELAIAEGADGVEVDVQMTADNVLVCYHDLELDENTEATGCINELNWSDLQYVKVYKSDYSIPQLEEIMTQTIDQGKKLFLDVKHLNSCTGEFIDYDQFNASLDLLLANRSVEVRERLVVNCRDIQLFQHLVDTSVQRSLESEQVAGSIDLIEDQDLDMLTIRLDELSESDRSTLDMLDISVSIYNLKSRTEIKRALQLDPEFVITDNLKCTLIARYGE